MGSRAGHCRGHYRLHRRLPGSTDGERVLKACATNPTKGYFAIGSSTNIETALKDAFTSIAGSISIAARAGSVADTMGDKVQLVFKDAAPIITTDMAVYAAGNADVYISQGTAPMTPRPAPFTGRSATSASRISPS